MKRFAIALILLAAVPATAAIISVQNDLSTRSNYTEGVVIGAQTATFRGVVVATSQASSDTIDFRFHRQMMVRLASGTTATLDIYVEGEPEGGSFGVLYNDDGTTQIGASITLNGTGWQVIDVETFPAGAIRFEGDTAGTIDVCLKG